MITSLHYTLFHHCYTCISLSTYSHSIIVVLKLVLSFSVHSVAQLIKDPGPKHSVFFAITQYLLLNKELQVVNT